MQQDVRGVVSTEAPPLSLVRHYPESRCVLMGEWLRGEWRARCTETLCRGDTCGQLENFDCPSCVGKKLKDAFSSCLVVLQYGVLKSVSPNVPEKKKAWAIWVVFFRIKPVFRANFQKP